MFGFKKGSPQSQKRIKEEIISQFVYRFLEKTAIHVAGRTVHPGGHRTDTTPQIAVAGGFHLEDGGVSPRPGGLEEDRTFCKDPVDDLFQWQVFELEGNQVYLKVDFF